MPSRYGVKEGQRYSQPWNESSEILTVIDTKTYDHCGDVIVQDQEGKRRRIDSFKLAMVRYTLEE